MYRVLIVDDEPFIVDSLERLLTDNISCELDIVKAYFPTKAIEIAKNTKLDLIISDVRMPKMTGIRMMQEIYQYWPNVKVVFLTGFSDFECIYKITKEFGAKYILKNEDDEIIIALIEGLLKEIEEENKLKYTLLKHKDNDELLKPLVLKRIFNGLIRGEKISNNYISSQFNKININLDLSREVVLLIGNINFLDNHILYDKKLQQIHYINNLLKKCIEHRVSLEYLITDELRVIWIIQSSTEKSEDIINYIRGVLEVVQNDFYEAYKESTNYFITYSNNIQLNLKEVYGNIETVIGQVTKKNQEMRIVCVDNTVIDLELQQSSIKQDDNKIIESIKMYIENNLNKDLSLITLANRVYMNPSYFSRLFKKSTNKNLSLYIQDLKIEKAKRMLEDNKYKVSEIAEKVGFDSPAYFATYFKRITKDTPQSYREKYVIEELNKAL